MSAIRPDPVDDAADLLDEVYNFVGRFVAYPSEAAHVAHVLWIAHTHMMQAWESTPRIAFLSPEPGSGKTRALEISELLVPRPVEAVNVTPAYLFRKVADEAGAPTILFDEIDTIFGPKAKDNEEIRGLLNAGHRRGASAGRCVVRGKIIETEEIPAYCAVALAGLGDLPDTILTRSVIIRMRRRSPDETVEPYRRRAHKPDGDEVHKRLAAWASFIAEDIGAVWPEMPPGIKDRDADVWEPLLAIADAAGGKWPELARVSCVSLVSASKVGTPSLGIRLLADLKTVFGSNDKISTKTIIENLCALPEAPWSDLRGKPLSDTGLAERLKPYGVKSKQIRIGEWGGKGYERADLHDAWKRYLSTPAHDGETPETSETREAAE
ncbi:DUF3631 domain-containing protein [Mesorhizobium sp. B2-4-14]|uniref:DUF3631 domain-containing protein n=1 Tax=Mesorhizobium sp. B2-4-14 TaxID=2589935 RepID=UPI0011297C42|nr:DUF3631 domain-containing protein [Mesorhizobium sp. B2-4-14]TPL06418.1 DUF3631 domain-containing protein [Mesorhizobium sp. B2-4-14]